ncbi:hypothetical protein E6B08_17650 [Pseudomonas putida]|uniref:Uncharacterized protein n=1 Tax=Pseudomonas putida TaxID=303 RepID=A0A4D6X9J1_PSEPU|nr:hypothetical protein [Pseudomonas putida]QCI13082.1 hypothetical protein E6B08_17650 [Pseudomonas putida]
MRMPEKQTLRPKFGQQNWLGDVEKPRYFTRYTLPGLVRLVYRGLVNVIGFILSLSAVFTVARWALERVGMSVDGPPITGIEWCIVAAVASVVAARKWRQRAKRSCLKVTPLAKFSKRRAER